MRTFQKKTLLFLPVILFVIALVTEVFAKPKLHIIITTKYKGQDCAIEGGWCINISVWGERVISLPGVNPDPDARPADLQVSDDGRTATLVFTDSRNSLPFQVFEAEADLVLSPEVSRELGCTSVTLLKGSYKVDFAKYPNGAIVFNTRVR